MRSLPILLALLVSATFNLSAQSYQWTWMHGDTATNRNGVYGVLNIQSQLNTPGARKEGSVWKDHSGNFWLFGGYGWGETTPSSLPGGRLNDLWRYNPGNNEWSWVKGAKEVDQPSIHGTKGVAAPSNQPGGRQTALTWTDNSGNLWLFGGFNASGLYNSLWKFDISTSQWTWMHGDQTGSTLGSYGTKGVPSPLNKPRGRYGGVSWKDIQGNLWLFGGFGDTATNKGGNLNDLWKYDPLTNMWTWMKGDSGANNGSNWGIQGVESPTNNPGSRINAVSWTDHSGNFWLYSGEVIRRNSSGDLVQETYSDLWKFNPVTNNWTWVHGKNSPGPSAVLTPPACRLGTGAVDASGDLIYFGGRYYNSVWKYNIANNQWSKLRGNDLGSPTANYGTKGVISHTNDPWGLSGSYSWADDQGNFWVFGGEDHTASWPGRHFNTLLKLSPVSLPVKLLSFKGRLQNKIALLSWEVEQKNNLGHYELQRSTNGIEFIKVASIPALNSKHYSHHDNLQNYNNSRFFYRLKSINKDGSFEYSFIIPLQVHGTNEITLYPNPARDFIRIAVNKPMTGKTELQIFDAAGKLVISTTEQSLSSGASIPVSHLVAGTYQLVIINNGERFSKSFAVHK